MMMMKRRKTRKKMRGVGPRGAPSKKSSITKKKVTRPIQMILLMLLNGKLQTLKLKLKPVKRLKKC